MAAAVSIERRLGPSAAGWVAALPVSFAVAVVTVTLDAGTATASTMALSAATIPAQVMFGIVFAAVLTRRGLGLGTVAGAFAYVGGSVVLGGAPAALVVVSRDPFADARAVFDAQRPATPGSPRRLADHRHDLRLSVVNRRRDRGHEPPCRAASRRCGSRLPDHERAPRDNRRDARRPLAGAHALTGLVRSLPCYLAFGLVVIVAAPSIGLASIALGLVACLGAAPATWRGVPVVGQPAPAQ